MTPTLPQRPAPLAPPALAAAPRPGFYLQLLTWLFTLFNAIRVFAYVPTMIAIHASGDSSQHSLLTWLVWVGANGTMAAWLYENNGRRLDKAVVVNIGNAAMCLATTVAILAYRL